MGYQFHKGELALQKRFNAKHNPKKVELLLRDSIVNTAIPFIENQTVAICSVHDKDGNIWASMLIGNTGFLKVVNDKLLRINLNQLQNTRNDISLSLINKHTKIGLLFIDTANRIRFRLNGFAAIFEDRIEVNVEESYPNCPKYIQQRTITFPEKTSANENDNIKKGTTLTESHRTWIKNADTFFLGSMNNNGNMDASHRGGPSGFIQLLEDDTLKIPDYVGNNLFNTLGNFLQYPKSGLLFVDYINGHTLQLSGTVSLLFDQETANDLQITTGTGRYWLFRPEQWIETLKHHDVNWDFISFSPFNP